MLGPTSSQWFFFLLFKKTDAEMQARLGIKSVPKTRFLDAEAAASLNMEERALPATVSISNFEF